MPFLIVLKRADILCRISGVYAIRRDIMRHYRTRSNDNIIADSGVASYNAVCANLLCILLRHSYLLHKPILALFLI